MPDSGKRCTFGQGKKAPEAVVMPAPGLVKLTCHKGASVRPGIVVCIERVDAVVKRCYVHHVMKLSPNVHVRKVKGLADNVAIDGLAEQASELGLVHVRWGQDSLGRIQPCPSIVMTIRRDFGLTEGEHTGENTDSYGCDR